jgi:hypothetical protein
MAKDVTLCLVMIALLPEGVWHKRVDASAREVEPAVMPLWQSTKKLFRPPSALSVSCRLVLPRRDRAHRAAHVGHFGPGQVNAQGSHHELRPFILARWVAPQ